MTKEETKAAIKVMQGYVEGKEIEVRLKIVQDTYGNVPGPNWNWEINSYRIKPQPPREFKFCVDCNIAPQSPDHIERYLDHEIITVIEQLPSQE